MKFATLLLSVLLPALLVGASVSARESGQAKPARPAAKKAAYNTARVYWSNKHTNLVNDQPGEAVINPLGFGEFVLAK